MMSKYIYLIKKCTGATGKHFNNKLKTQKSPC